MSEKNTGRVTIPTNLDVVPETIELMKRWGADAIRDCDGTEFPEELTKTGAKIYATYYTTRKDNEWAKANPDEVQQCYIMSGFYTAVESELQIPLMKGISDELMQVNTRDDIKRWWEVVDRSTGQVVSTKQWEYNEESGCVCIHEAEPFHEYTVSFLAYIIWDPVHMYNAVTNDWKDFEHQITFDVRQPKTHKYSMERLRKFCAEHPYVNVIRYTTFFHQFTLMFDELKREKYVDWYGYSASVSPYILEQFEKEVAMIKKKGVFDVVSGVLVGKPQDEEYYEEYKDVLVKVVNDPDLPIVYNVNFGHATPRCVLQYGAMARVDMKRKIIKCEVM